MPSPNAPEPPRHKPARDGPDPAAARPARVRPARRLRRRWAIPSAAFLLALVLTGGATAVATQYVHDRQQAQFDTDIDKVNDAIQRRMVANEQILRGGRGLFAASISVERAEWRAYVQTLNLSNLYPGIQGVGFSKLIAPEDLAAHEALIRAEGFPNYTVRPPGPRDVFTSIIYLEPFVNRNLRAFGYDMFSEPVRHEAMVRARDTGEAALSGKVTLVQETDTDVQAGFLIYLPVYRNGAPTDTVQQRRDALVGWVYSPFRIRDLMQGILGPGIPSLHFDIYAGAERDPASLLYASQGVPAASGQGVEHSVTYAGAEWTLVYRPAAKEQTLALLPGTAFGLGLVSSFLILGLTATLSGRRERALALADQMTRELRRSEEALAQSNKELEQFAYIAAHDLREPLRTVSTFTGLLGDRYRGHLDEKADEYIDFVVSGTLRMQNLVDGLLEYSRVNGERKPAEPVSLNEAWDEAIGNLQTQIQTTRSRVERDALATVVGHRGLLVRLFQNLVSNAIKYRGAKDAVVTCSARHDHGSLVVSVRDQGIGIDPKYQQQLFVLFRRLHAQHQIEGTGVGLAVCKRIVEQHGGRIWVESQEGQGATFHFVLPTNGRDHA